MFGITHIFEQQHLEGFIQGYNTEREGDQSFKLCDGCVVKVLDRIENPLGLGVTFGICRLLKFNRELRFKQSFKLCDGCVELDRIKTLGVTFEICRLPKFNRTPP